MLKMVFGESPFPWGSGRVLTQGCAMRVDGPFERQGWKWFVASAWCNQVCIGWKKATNPEAARRYLEDHLQSRYGIEVAK